MGEGEGGGGQDKNLLGPPSPYSPPTEKLRHNLPFALRHAQDERLSN